MQASPRYVSVPNRSRPFAEQYRRTLVRARRPASTRARSGSAAEPAGTHARATRRADTKQPSASPASGNSDSIHDAGTGRPTRATLDEVRTRDEANHQRLQKT
jgi:hypothetical protein